jgi:hypothetical protein
MTPTPPKTINYTVREGETLLTHYSGALADGLYHAAAHHLSGAERLDLIERLQAAHAEIEARGR